MSTGLPIHVETPIKLTVVSDDIFIDSSHVAGIQTITKEVVMTPDQVKARMENWEPVTGINSVNYDAEAMVEDLFGVIKFLNTKSLSVTVRCGFWLKSIWL